MSRSFDIITGSIRYRINKEDKSSMILIVGEMGSGKSLAAVSLACKVDPSFKTNPRIVYTISDFLETLNNSKKGQAIIWDEAGVGVPAREWMTAQNKIMSIVTQILRFKNVCVIFTTPNIRYLDINVREAMNLLIKPKAIDKEHNINACKVFTIYTTDLGEVRHGKFIYYDGKNGAAGEWIDPLYIPRPDEEMEAYYKKLSIDMKNTKLKELKEALAGEADPHPMKVEQIKSQAEVCIKLLKFFKQDYTWDEISDVAGYSRQQLNNWIKAPVTESN